MGQIRLFTVVRQQDESGISGTGHVITGIEFEDGTIAVRWQSDTPSTNIYASWEEFRATHIDAHPDNQSIVAEFFLGTQNGLLVPLGSPTVADKSDWRGLCQTCGDIVVKVLGTTHYRHTNPHQQHPVIFTPGAPKKS